MSDHPKTICVDFDGVVHSYDSGWQGVAEIADDPVPGALEWLAMVRKLEGWEFKIYSVRCSKTAGRIAIALWFKKHGLSLTADEIAVEKPPAVLYIDDRGYRFDGKFPTLVRMTTLLEPWNKKSASPPLMFRGSVTLGDLRKLDLPDDTVVALQDEGGDYAYMNCISYDLAEDQIELSDERWGGREDWYTENEEHDCPGQCIECREGDGKGACTCDCLCGYDEEKYPGTNVLLLGSHR